MTDAAPYHTAARIARALNVTPQAVRKRLADTPGRTIAVRGQSTTAWTLEELPAALRGGLDAAATRRGRRTVADLLRDPPAPWSPALPWHAATPDDQRNAGKLRDALAPALARQHELSDPDLIALAGAGYRALFGHEIDAAKLRHLLDRATRRDNGFHQWERPELYLGGTRPAAVQSAPVPAPHDAMVTALDGVKDRLHPTMEDRAFLFDAAFTHLENVSAGRARNEARHSLIAWLYQHLPALYRPQSAGAAENRGKPLIALRRSFDRYYQAWLDGGKNPAALIDRRATHSGNFKDRLPDADRALLIDAAVECDGDESQAWRRLHLLGKFSETVRERFPFNDQRKSYVPQSVRDDVAPEITTRLLGRRGPHHIAACAPKAVRDWTAVPPYAWLGLDDVTWNHPFAVRDPLTNRVRLVRGECILSTATRINYVLHHTLIAGMIDGEKTSFNSWHVRGNILHVHDKVGLPSVGLNLENNVFAARMIRGDARPKWDDVHWRVVNQGLRHEDLQLETHYHKPGTPWAKPIERVIGLIQQRMNCEPGYVGRNERLDRREQVQKKMSAVLSQKLTPEAAGFLWFEDFAKMLDTVITEYNNEVQNGEMLLDTTGIYLSPEQAWTDGICGHPGSRRRPNRQLSPEGRARLATHTRKVFVGDKGIEIDVDRRRLPFWDESLVPFRNKHVLAHINIIAPEALICSDLDQTQFFPVKLQKYSAMDAVADDLKGLYQARAKYTAPSRVIQSRVKPSVISVISRANDVSQTTQALGRAANAAVDEHNTETARGAAQIKTLEGILGRQVGTAPRNAGRVIEGHDLEQEALREIAAMENPSPEAAP